MGVEAYLLASTLRAVMAQRLVRRLCPNCKTERPATAVELDALGFGAGDTVMVGEPNGCFSCSNTGFDGRIGIYELLVVDSNIRELLGSEASEHRIDEAAFAGHDRLIDNARRYVVSQETSPAEVLRVSRKGGG
jgi:general secretion pathway protein E